MKVNFKYAMMAAALLSMGATSCSNDNEPEVKEGKQTQMTVSINFPKGDETRATSDVNAKDTEAAVKTVDVFIYNASGAFLSRTPLTAGDFSSADTSGSADKYTYIKSTKIATTTGAKNVFVGINLPTAVASALENKTMQDLSSTAQTLTRAQLTTIANGLPMFSSTPATSVFVEDDTDTANKVSVTAERLVAKVTVEKADDMVVAGVPGTLGNLSFAINNFNERMFMVQGATPTFKDPNWASGSYQAAEFSKAVAADYVAVNSKATDVKTLNACYASENTSADRKKKEITRATVRATFIPANIMIADGAGYKETANTATTPATFWAYTKEVGANTVFFTNQTLAEGYATANGGAAADVKKYTDGYCYWDMFLNVLEGNKAAKWDVARNEYFRCTIKRIVALGRNTDDVTDPEVTPSADTSITVDIAVSNWNTPILADYDLEP